MYIQAVFLKGEGGRVSSKEGARNVISITPASITTYFLDESDKVRNARSLLFGGCGGARYSGAVTHVIIAAVLLAGDAGQPAVDGARTLLRNAQKMVVIWPKDNCFLLLTFLPKAE